MLQKKIWRFKISLAEYYRDIYNKILKNIINGDLIHADETKINFQRGSGYVWVFTNMDEVIYLCKSSREANFLHGLLKDFKGVLITDFYSGYDSIDCMQQKCLVHLIRDLNNALLKNPLDEELKDIVLPFGNLIKQIVNTIDKFGLKKLFLKKHKKDIERFYKKLTIKTFYSEIAEKFKHRLIKYRNKIFLFIDYNNIPWNNNNAEHAIKHFAKYRSTVNGSLSADGSEAYLILLSIYQTCRYKGINFLDFLLSKEKDIDVFIEKCRNKKYRSKIRQ